MNTEALPIAIEKILREHGQLVYEATEKGLDAAEKILIRNLENESPRGETRRFIVSWKSEKGHSPMLRFVGNAKTVKRKRGKPIPLSNILEYSTVRGKPFIKKTFEKSVDAMAAAVAAEIKKGV
jgi:hypothetical protein